MNPFAETFQTLKNSEASWQEVPYLKKVEAIQFFQTLLEKSKKDLARLLTLEMGKPITQSLAEISALRDRIQFFTDHTEAVLQKRTVFHSPHMTEEIEFQPLGTILNISAWNYPYFVGSNVFIPALLTGNCVLYKPSEYTSKTGLAIESLLHESLIHLGLPKDVFKTVTGGGETAEKLLELPINGIFFTGSYGTGRKIAQKCKDRMIRIQMELGGKDPAYVCQDAHLPHAIDQLIDGVFYNTGQSCCSVERIYVHHSIYSDFLGAFLERVRSLKIGNPMDPQTNLGPLARSAQAKVLEAQVQDALQKGGELLTGGASFSTNDQREIEVPGEARYWVYFKPTVITQVNHTMSLMREESFGPVIGIQKVETDKEAVQLMNDTEYGLTASVFSQNRAHAQAILKKVTCGTVYWNTCDRISPRLPWSGRKQSGQGYTLSTLGIESFLQPKAWHLSHPES